MNINMVEFQDGTVVGLHVNILLLSQETYQIKTNNVFPSPSVAETFSNVFKKINIQGLKD